MDANKVREESIMAHMQLINQRLSRILIISILTNVLMFSLVIGAVFYFLKNFDLSLSTVTVDSHEGTANYIGNDGDINNGAD